MLARGRDRLCDQGFIVPVAQCDAEKLPFPDDYFDCVTVAFGLRNMTHKDLALAEMRRVLRPGGRLLVLEFSQIWKPLAPAYDFYSFKLIPRLGQMITDDEASYRYLAESIRVHPDQEALKQLDGRRRTGAGRVFQSGARCRCPAPRFQVLKLAAARCSPGPRCAFANHLLAADDWARVRVSPPLPARPRACGWVGASLLRVAIERTGAPGAARSRNVPQR
jgi:SAM-dependent methyltransferase